MADPNTIYKMTILAMLDKADFPLANTQIASFFLEHDYTGYFTIQQMLHMLCDSDLIWFETTRSNTLYSLTKLGKETLRFFKDKITPAIEEDIIAFFQKNKLKMKMENSIMADYYKSSQSGFDVRCRLKENASAAVDLTLHVQTKAQAEAVCKNWQKQHMEIYVYLMDLLVR